jgi:hypothetical protein
MAEFWARMGGITISDAMVLLEAKIGEGRALIESMARRKAAAAMAWEKGITVPERVVEEALERFYGERGLSDTEEIHDFQARHHLKEEAVRSHVRELLLIALLKTLIVTAAMVEERFRARSKDFRQLDLEEFSFASEEAAQTFIQAVEAGEMEPRLGERRLVAESRLPSSVAEALAQAKQGTLVGPFLAAHRKHVVFRLAHRLEPHLDDALRESLREELFREAIEPVLKKDPLTFML